MIALGQFDSPLGPVSVAERAGRVLCVHFGSKGSLRRRYPRLEPTSDVEPSGLGPVARKFAGYLLGGADHLDVEVDWSLVQSEFDKTVLYRLYRLEKGRVISYDELGRLAGKTRAARAVGGAMRRNPLPVIVPCHRVLPRSGGLGYYTGGVEKKAWLLAREGLTIDA